MRTTAIIAEFNPFHNGHSYLLGKAREQTGADFVLILMSGDYVQRGTPALFSKYVRTEASLLCGADLVLELPLYASTASAQGFAEGAVRILDRLGVVDTLLFGSESGDITGMWDLGESLSQETDSYRQTLRQHLQNGLSFPAARAAALDDDAALVTAPNDILGVEYCRALHLYGSEIKPATVLRSDRGYHDLSTEDTLLSASSIRRDILSNQVLPKNGIPDCLHSLYKEMLESHSFLTEDDYSVCLFYALLNCHTPAALAACADVSDDLANKIFKNRSLCNSFTQFADLLKSKDLTRTRINRALLHILLEIHPVDVKPYTRILGFRKIAAPLLSEIKKAGRLPVVTKLADAGQILDDSQYRTLSDSIHASTLYRYLLQTKSGISYPDEYMREIIIR